MRVRKCNWQCYEAKSKDCRCQCNGLNHGVGAEQARENYRKLGLMWSIPGTRRIGFRTSRKRRVPPEQGYLFASIHD
jgi:hypothetical protein